MNHLASFISPKQSFRGERPQSAPSQKRPSTAGRTRPSSARKVSIAAPAPERNQTAIKPVAQVRCISAKAKTQDAKSIAIMSTKHDTNSIGIPGYVIPRDNFMKASFNATMPVAGKDDFGEGKGQSFIATIERQALKTKGPDHYFKQENNPFQRLGVKGVPDPRLVENWHKAIGDFHKGPERKTQLDEIFEKNKIVETSTPAPWDYQADNAGPMRWRILNGQFTKEEKIDLVTRIQNKDTKDKMFGTDPAKYYPIPVEKHIPEARMHEQIHEKKTTIVKEKGEFKYELVEAKAKVLPKSLETYIGPDKASGIEFKDRETYFAECQRRKKWMEEVKAIEQEQLINAFKKSDTPYLKKRLS